MVVIPGFTNYSFCINTKTVKNIPRNKLVTVSSSKKSGTYVKIKSDAGAWKSISINTLESLCFPPEPPIGYVEVDKYPGVFINEFGQVWLAPTKSSPLGKYGTVYFPKDSKHYPSVSTKYGTLAIHQLLALAFLDSNYSEKGLCVMHLDDDKHNFKLSNLKVGTYSENNKAAYDSGVNSRL